jgi:hydrogenase/urease accessory protein HupE
MPRLILILNFWVLLFCSANAHEVRPAYLSIAEDSTAEFTVIWKQPILDGKRLRIEPMFPEICIKSNPKRSIENSTVIEKFNLKCGLIKGEIVISGLEQTMTDVIIKIDYLSGKRNTSLIKPNEPKFILGTKTSIIDNNYLSIGIDHILRGWDHLLFIIGLVLLINRRQILGVATAFTIAHSLTLGLAAFSIINLPSQPVEILIAMSIVLLGVEIMRKKSGVTSISSKHPYIIALMIGLIHGCGFAGALADIGLPKGMELFSLLLFNLGVELGQFAIIGLTILTLTILARVSNNLRKNSEIILTYGISSIGMFWIIERVSDYII